MTACRFLQYSELVFLPDYLRKTALMDIPEPIHTGARKHIRVAFGLDEYMHRNYRNILWELSPWLGLTTNIALLLSRLKVCFL
jgi:hypothetical protein